MGLVWKEPPPRRSGAGADYAGVIEQLKANPGRWALITDQWSTNAAPTAFAKAGCEVTCRRIKDSNPRKFEVYARYPETQPEEATHADPKADVKKAIAPGTALKPPTPALTKVKGKQPAQPAPPGPANDFGLSAFRAARAARGVPEEGIRR